MILYDANSPGPNPVTVRQFVLERGGLEFDVEHIDLMALANRQPDYLRNINARGEVPALRLEDSSVLTEITAICEYFDEIAEGGVSLFGDTAEERAMTHMWVRRVYLEICSPFTTWWRGTEMAIQLYQGHRDPATSAQEWMQKQAEKGLEQLNKDLEGKIYIANGKLTMADIILNAFIATMSQVVPWLERPDLKNLTAWRAMMAERPSSQQMFEPLPKQVK